MPENDIQVSTMPSAEPVTELRPRGFAPPRPPAEVFVLLGLYVSERRLTNLAPTIGSLRQTTL